MMSLRRSRRSNRVMPLPMTVPVGGAVVTQKQLVETGRPGGDVEWIQPGGQSQQRADRAGDRELQAGVVVGEHLDPVDAPEPSGVHGFSEPEVDGFGGAGAQ